MHEVQMIHDGNLGFCNSMWYHTFVTILRFTRGLAASGNWIFTGQGRVRQWKIKAPEQLPNTSLDCGVLVYNAKNDKTRFMSLNASQIHQISLYREFF